MYVKPVFGVYRCVFSISILITILCHYVHVRVPRSLWHVCACAQPHPCSDSKCFRALRELILKSPWSSLALYMCSRSAETLYEKDTLSLLQKAAVLLTALARCWYVPPVLVLSLCDGVLLLK